MPAEKRFAIPSELPKNAAFSTGSFAISQKIPREKIPAYLRFDALDENAKAKLAYAIAERGGDVSEILRLAPASEALAVARAYAAAKGGSEKDIASIISSGDLISPAFRPIVSSYIASVKSKDTPEILMGLMAQAKNTAQSALLVDALGKFELGALVKKLFDGFEKMTPEMQISTLKTGETIANEDVFEAVAAALPSLSDKKVSTAAIRALLKCASVKFAPKMFDQIAAAYPKCDKSVRANLVRFASFDSSAKAVEFCKTAYTDGCKAEAVKALGDWRNTLALDPLVRIAKSERGEKEKIFAQQALVKVGAFSGFDAESFGYIIKNAVRSEEKSAAIDGAVKNPSPEAADMLEKNGYTAEAAKVRDALKKVKTTYMSNHGAEFIKLALDGDISTRYTSGTPIKIGDWIAFDFGYAKKVSEIVFNLGTSKRDFPDEFEVLAGSSEAAAVRVDGGNPKGRRRYNRQVPCGIFRALCKICRAQRQRFLLVSSRTSNQVEILKFHKGAPFRRVFFVPPARLNFGGRHCVNIRETKKKERREKAYFSRRMLLIIIP